MPRIVNTHEAEIAVLAYLAVFDAIDHERSVACGTEFGAVGVGGGQGNSFAAKPVADIICIAVVEGNANGVVEEHFEIWEESRIGEVAGSAKGIEDVTIGLGAV